MSNTIPGGRYLRSDGVTYQNANGEVIESSVVEKIEAGLSNVFSALKTNTGDKGVVASDLPENFPARAVLIEAGLTTLEKVMAASDETLTALRTIDKATLKAIRSYAR